ncbi:MAG TPA: hypothetical protein VM165_10550 [Planctomycetaceae bacterium]|nr:hypothetical protein [Planctomycetaceae bacterium]
MSTTTVPMQVCEGAFARSLGFETFDDLIEASEPLFSSVGELWFVAELPDGHWMAWPFPEYDDTHRFDSYEEAAEFVRPSALD